MLGEKSGTDKGGRHGRKELMDGDGEGTTYLKVDGKEMTQKSMTLREIRRRYVKSGDRSEV